MIMPRGLSPTMEQSGSLISFDFMQGVYCYADEQWVSFYAHVYKLGTYKCSVHVIMVYTMNG